MFEPLAPLRRVDVELPVSHDVIQLHRVRVVGAGFEFEEGVVHEGPVVDGSGERLSGERATRKHQEGATASGDSTEQEWNDE